MHTETALEKGYLKEKRKKTSYVYNRNEPLLNNPSLAAIKQQLKLN